MSGDVVGLSALALPKRLPARFYGQRMLRPGAAERFVALAERNGLAYASCSGMCGCFAVLDLLDADGDIIDDRCVPREVDWDALNSELGLAVTALVSS